MSELDPSTSTADERVPESSPAPPFVPPAVSADPPPPRRPRNRMFWGMLSGCLVGFVLLTILSTFFAAAGTDVESEFSPGAKVAVVPVEGEIIDARAVIELLEHYAEKRSVRAIVVRINSPGGAIVPSQEIFEAIRRVRRDYGKPVVASLDSVAASGGYYVAVGCDRIVSNPGTLTGSIGVIAQWFNMEDLVRWAKLKPETFTSGTMKDAGSPFKPSNERDRAYFQHIVSQLHDQFVRAVAAGRKGHLTVQQVRALADGRVFTGEEALKLKLVDELGDLQAAVDLASEMAGLEDGADVIYPREEEPGLLEMLADTKTAEKLIGKVLKTNDAPFQYRWRF
jgi:protease-4